MRAKLLHALYSRDKTEEWKSLPINSDYSISSWGRCLHKKSYGGKPRLLIPTIKNNKYAYVTVNFQGKRKGISLNRIISDMFHC